MSMRLGDWMCFGVRLKWVNPLLQPGEVRPLLGGERVARATKKRVHRPRLQHTANSILTPFVHALCCAFDGSEIQDLGGLVWAWRARASVGPATYNSSAIWTALSAAPLRSWSPTTQNARPFSKPRSSRSRPTSQSSCPATASGVG